MKEMQIFNRSFEILKSYLVEKIFHYLCMTPQMSVDRNYRKANFQSERMQNIPTVRSN